MVDGVVVHGPEVLDGVRAPGAPVGARAVRAAGVAGRPRRSAPRRMPRSVGRKASGSPRARMAMDSTVQGPKPGSAESSARARAQSVSWSRRSVPSARAATRVVSVVRRVRGSASFSGSSPASASGVGKRWVSPPSGSSTSTPWAVTRRAAWVRAAAVETCWPRTARTANSAPSTVRGTRRPGPASTSGASSGSVRSRSSTATGSASRSRSQRHRLIACVRSRGSVRESRAAMWPGCGVRATVPWPYGRVSVRR